LKLRQKISVFLEEKTRFLCRFLFTVSIYSVIANLN